MQDIWTVIIEHLDIPDILNVFAANSEMAALAKHIWPLLIDCDFGECGNTAEDYCHYRSVAFLDLYDQYVFINIHNLPNTYAYKHQGGHLNLYNNFIKDVIGKSFSNITHLDLDNNKIEHVIGWKLPSKLEVLYLNCNNIQNVIGWKLPEGLQQLDISNNTIEDVKDWILPNSLAKCDLSENNITCIDYWKFPFNLTNLDLSYNSIDVNITIDNCLSESNWLDLSYNNNVIVNDILFQNLPIDIYLEGIWQKITYNT